MKISNNKNILLYSVLYYDSRINLPSTESTSIHGSNNLPDD